MNVSNVENGEMRRADHHAISRDGLFFAPMRELIAVLQAALFYHPAVGDHIIIGGRCYHEFGGSFVVRMIDPGKPIMRAVRPVVSEERQIAVLVLANDQTVAWMSVIFDRDATPFATAIIPA